MRVWLGQRESDIQTTNNYYDRSITFYGSNTGGNSAYCSDYRMNAYYDDSYYDFVISKLDELIAEHPDLEAHFYSGGASFVMLEKRPDLQKYFKYVNDQMLLDWFNNKTYTRVWLQNSVLTPQYLLLSKSQCTFKNLSARFPGFDEFILQLNHSSGGKGTWKMNSENEDKLHLEIPTNEPLLVSPYYADTISANCHMVIGETESILFPTSVQFINVRNDKMIYSGGDFATGREVDAEHWDKLYSFKSTIAKLMSDAGFRGVCGLDYLIYGDEVMLIEINPRYQGSTFILNHALVENGCPHVSAFTVAAFDGNDAFLTEWKSRVEHIDIDLQGHVVTLSPDFTLDEARQILNTMEEKQHVFLDGFLEAKSFESSPYLFKYF